MAFPLPDLPYAYDALEPHMSADTLKFHHDKHHKSYVDKLNAAIEGTKFEGMKLEEIIQEAAKGKDTQSLFNNAAQAWNHTFFWHCMSPESTGRPDGELARAIDEAFGGFDEFKQEFVAKAGGQFGSGWAWLVLDNGKLTVTSTPNAGLPMTNGQQALLTCDVWEHAYYLDYQNRRPDFVKTFLDRLVDWEFVAENFAMQGEGGSMAGRRYQDMQHRFAESGKVEKFAREAEHALEGEEGAELERARRQTASGHSR